MNNHELHGAQVEGLNLDAVVDEWTDNMAALTAAIWTPSTGLERRRRQMIFAYIRCPSKNSRYIMVCRRRFAEYCWQRNLRVGGVFIDHGLPDTMLNRPEFGALCYTLKTEQVQGVLLIHARHLSNDPSVALQLAERIWLTGTQIYTVRGEAPLPAAPLPVVDLQ